MQPPFIPEGLRTKVERLKRQVEERNRQAELCSTKTCAVSEPITSEYVRLIQAWLEGQSGTQRERAYTINEIVSLAALQGHYRSAASLRHAGEALRRCGFRPCRDWTVAGRNRRYWKLS